MPRRSIIALAQSLAAAARSESGKVAFPDGAVALPTRQRACTAVVLRRASIAAGTRPRALAAGER